MKTISKFLIAIFAAATLSQCAEPMGPNTQRGAAVGALGGAALGGIVGHQSGRALEGAALGAAAGGVVGGVAGNQKDKRYYDRNY
ncbi:MAG: hypothetical protein EAZ42_02220 [Verrucomicrobia bacterium]|nr:MAG: hypothetical protein EAZ42_02220 [Verrucomicrobiota bacterium]